MEEDGIATSHSNEECDKTLDGDNHGYNSKNISMERLDAAEPENKDFSEAPETNLVEENVAAPEETEDDAPMDMSVEAYGDKEYELDQTSPEHKSTNESKEGAAANAIAVEALDENVDKNIEVEEATITLEVSPSFQQQEDVQMLRSDLDEPHVYSNTPESDIGPDFHVETPVRGSDHNSEVISAPQSEEADTAPSAEIELEEPALMPEVIAEVRYEQPVTALHELDEQKDALEEEDNAEQKDALEEEDNAEQKDALENEDNAEQKDELEDEDNAEQKDELEDEDNAEQKDELEDEDNAEQKDELEDEDNAEQKDDKEDEPEQGTNPEHEVEPDTNQPVTLLGDVASANSEQSVALPEVEPQSIPEQPDGSEHYTEEPEADVELESNFETPDPEEITQSYLNLLLSGKLASKKKMETQERGKEWTPSAARSWSPTRRSVFDPGMTKLKDSSRNLEAVAPLRPTSGRSSLALTPQSPRQHLIATSRKIDLAVSPHPYVPRTAPSSPNKLAPINAANRVFTPGPGAYTPTTDRYGARDASDNLKNFSFGSSKQRPWHVCIQGNVVSPGPIYKPPIDFSSTVNKPAGNMFGRRDVGTRFSLSASMPSNCPHWNPGPGDYKAVSIYKGGSTKAGKDVPKATFGNSQKLVSPEARLSATVFISNDHAMHENVSVHSPGPFIYSPKQNLVKESPSSYTMLPRAPSYFDTVLDPFRQPSPGPIYTAAKQDHRGLKLWGNEPKTTFGRSGKMCEPEISVNSTGFISKLHALHCNQSVHSPGPIYFPTAPMPRSSVPHLHSGPLDRFYNRREFGRLG
ncbi:hypothetical protein CEUSTIGMA_g7250.t1 [Chlamydomonas eustigma]|uniref:Uncharacterized protein n=1 Tax=Chlamydomonas eustigma TaxID=1157962 RepID=A0A250XAM0_9CHLO|nr:hypothetical protein CEUSTIGMA_g7250.t1 [Chlamydomonas eustigma]|eukprot:GAX79810.1 hypothetical protein CEUSTIGMA_g7250.t1 [Chlamydomonas eustigma]